MRMLAALLLASVFPAAAWTLRDGRVFEAELAAADGLRATFTRPDKPPVVMPIERLSDDDVAAVREWRRDRANPLVLPEAIAPWPKQAFAPKEKVRGAGGSNGWVFHESPHFRIGSDLKLPAHAVDDIASVLEATRSALIAIPLGLHAGGETEKYRVFLFRDRAGYAAAGGINGSGGHYDGRTRRMLVLLPNLGIEETGGSLRLDHRNNLFVLKHEVVHQLMAPWHRRLPMWLNEGLAEFIASLPYSQGAYTLRPPGAGMRDYLLKWQPSRDDRTLRIVPPERLMAMDLRGWNRAVKEESAYDLYNSANLLVYHFIRRENGAPFAGFLADVRAGEEPRRAEELRLLGDGGRAGLHEGIAATAKDLGIELADPF